MIKIEKIIGDLIENQGISILSSIDAEGFPNTKALLQPRKIEGIKTIYFSTNTSSSKVGNFRQNSKACLYFYDKRLFKGVMLKGNVEILEDSKTKELIWREGDTLFYPLGVTDPDYCVLKFTALSGRYYSDLKSQDFVIE